MFRALLLLGLASAAPASAAGLAPEAIVAKADEARNPQNDYVLRVSLVSFKKGAVIRRAEYEVMIKGKKRTLIKTLAPANERGTSILMRDRDLWTFLPDVSQPVRISLQQRLIGEVAIGDVARANFAGDYRARLLREGKNGYVLELTALSDDVTYGKVVYKVGKGDFRPLNAAFYAVSGKLLKTCAYQDYKMLAGRLRPARLVMTDAVNASLRTILQTDAVDEAELPEKYFTKDHLKKTAD